MVYTPGLSYNYLLHGKIESCHVYRLSLHVCACARVRVCACARVRVCACAHVRVCARVRLRARVCVCLCARLFYFFYCLIFIFCIILRVALLCTLYEYRLQRVVFQHPGFQSDGSFGLPYDIALVELMWPIKFSKFISPVKLLSGQPDDLVGSECYIMGWGQTSGE